MNDLEKLQLLLPHWIEHQVEHESEFRTWAERFRLDGQMDVADRLLAAADSLRAAGHHLSGLQKKVKEIQKS